MNELSEIYIVILKKFSTTFPSKEILNVCWDWVGFKGIWNLWGIYKLKGEHMKIPLTKYDGPPTKYDIPLAFNKRNSTGQHIISCEDSLYIKGSHAKYGMNCLKGIYPMVRLGYMKCWSSIVQNVPFKRTWPSVCARQYLVFVNDIWYLLKVFCIWYLVAIALSHKYITIYTSWMSEGKKISFFLDSIVVRYCCVSCILGFFCYCVANKGSELK